VQKKIELGKLDTFKVQNTITAKTFYQTDYIRPLENKIRNNFRKEKSSFFFLNLPARNLKIIQKNINAIKEVDFDKIECKIADNVLRKFDKD
jgi:hypothetical protein